LHQSLSCFVEKEKEDAKLSKKDKTKRDLDEIDKLFAQMGIEVPQEEKKEPQESKKSKKKKKKEKKDTTENAEVKNEDKPAEENKQDKPAEEKKLEQTVEQTNEAEAPADKEAAIKEALNKRFKPQNKKQHQDDAAMLAKKEALVSWKRACLMWDSAFVW
jgi:hypothetical protein